MSAEAMTLDQVRAVGIDALSRSLGPVGMIRFLQQTEMGWGDYTSDRETWLGDPDLRELFNSIKARSSGDSLLNSRAHERKPSLCQSAKYLKLVEWSDEDQCFIGECPGIIGPCCHGDDEVQVYDQLCRIVDEWIQTMQDDGKPLPPPTAGNNLAS